MMKEYQIVKGSEGNIRVFERRVNSFIRDGWEPLGSVTCVWVVGDVLYRQAMVKGEIE